MASIELIEKLINEFNNSNEINEKEDYIKEIVKSAKLYGYTNEYMKQAKEVYASFIFYNENFTSSEKLEIMNYLILIYQNEFYLYDTTEYKCNCWCGTCQEKLKEWNRQQTEKRNKFVPIYENEIKPIYIEKIIPILKREEEERKTISFFLNH